MMLALADYDLVALADEGFAETERGKIDGRGGSSPSPTKASPKLNAARLTDAVVPEVKTISFGLTFR